MKILGIDTATRFLSLGFSDNARVYEYNLDVARRLSGLITLTIKRIMDALGWQINDVDYFACGLGPGSFTGIRVGIATVKGLSFSLNKPTIGISTLDIIAMNAADTDAYIIPMVDARRDLIYTSIYRHKGGRLLRIKPYMLLSMDEFFKKIKIKGRAVILGDAVSLYKQNILANMKSVTLLDKDYWYPRGHNIIDLAKEKIGGKKVNSAYGIEPIYLYPKECQVKSVTSLLVTKTGRL